MIIRKATANDIDSVEKLYGDVHTAEEEGKQTVGWIRGVYPVRATAQEALERDDLFVLEDDGTVYGAAIINKIQADIYSKAHWKHSVADEQVCVLHTLVISPNHTGRGYGKEFIRYYETYALNIGCAELRIDTNEKNTVARKIYTKLGYTKTDIVHTDFNGIPGINLVLFEKYLGK